MDLQSLCYFDSRIRSRSSRFKNLFILLLLLFLLQDVKGPQTVAFNLPNDERIVKDRGTSMVILKNVSEAKYDLYAKKENFCGLTMMQLCIFYCLEVSIFLGFV